MNCKYAIAKKLVEKNLCSLYNIEATLYREKGCTIASYDPNSKKFKFWHPNILETYMNRDRLESRISCYEYIILLFFHEYGHCKDTNSKDYIKTFQQLKRDKKLIELYKYQIKLEINAWEYGKKELELFLNKKGFENIKQSLGLNFEVRKSNVYLEYYDIQNENNIVDYDDVLSLNYSLSKDAFVKKVKELIKEGDKFDEIKGMF